MAFKHLVWMYLGLFAVMLDGWVIYLIPHPFGMLFYILQIPLIIWGIFYLIHGAAENG